LPVQERVWILSKLAAVQFTAGNAAAAIALLTEAISSYQFPSRIGARLLRKIATLQWKAGDSAAAKETSNTARIAAQGSTGVNELLCVERSQIKIGDTLGAQATRTAALLKTRNPNSRPRSRIDGWMRIAAASAEVGDQVASREVLAEALAAALELEDSKIRSLTVRDVIQGYLVIGDLEMASSLIEKIEHQYTRRLVIHAVAQVRDNPGTARRLYKLRCGWEYGAIVSSCRRQREMHEGTHYGEARSLAIDAVDQINAGKSSEAIETLNQALSHARQLSNGPPINPEYRRDRTLALIAPMQAAAGLENAASETVRNIDHVVSRNIALRDIAMVRVHAGNIKGALLNVWWIAKQPIDTRPTVRARALGYVALAIGSHSANPDHQTLNWCALMVFYGIKCGLSCTKTDVWSAYF
ncbi:MAG: hypothetical protein O6831_00470, partial [Alphaproteobacteria bacterium]|nr:hypothetical protein [Alphaproteobacteria bacterium]